MKHHLKVLLQYVGKYWWLTVLGPLLILAEVALEVAIPIRMGELIDEGLHAVSTSAVAQTGTRVIIMAAIALVLGAASAIVGSIAANGFAKNLRMALMEKISRFSFANRDKFTTASLVTRTTQDITFIQQSFMLCMRMMIRNPVMLVMAIYMAVRINGRLSLIMLAAALFLSFTVYIISKNAHPQFQKMLKRYDKLNATTQENLIGIRVAKAFVRKKHEEDKFNESADDLRRAQYKAERIIILNGPVMTLTMYACLLATLWLGGQDLLNGNMEPGLLISYLSYIGNVLISLMLISMALINIIVSTASIRRIVEVLDEVPSIDANESSAVQVENGEITFENVDFSYMNDPKKLHLQNINLHIPSGSVLGILGEPGSGKTTLVQLIPRLYDVYAGSLRVGGHDVREYAAKTLRANIGMVLQKNVLFSGTIRDNLLWGKEDATQEDLDKATEAACAKDFIRSFPQGYDTKLEQGGVNLSGGQRQRLCIARALLRNPKILILDDSTSAVDTATDAKIRAAFRNEYADVTKIIIAQRVSSIEDADKIMVLHEGQISAQGTHAELLENSEMYREICQSQQKGVL